MTGVEQDRAAAYEFFVEAGKDFNDGWVQAYDYFAAFKGGVTYGQGKADLQALVKARRLEKRSDPAGRKTARGLPFQEYRAVLP